MPAAQVIYVKGCTEEMQEGSAIPSARVWCFCVSHNFLCYFQTLLRGEKSPSPLSTGCVGGMEEALFQSASFQQSCCSCFRWPGGSLTLSFLLHDTISRNSLQGFYKQLCKTNSVRNEADA